MSLFIRELLEDSPFLVSNEELKEPGVNDCIAHLQKHRQQRELAEMVRRAEAEGLPPDQHDAYLKQFHSRIRETRGSPPADEGK